MQCERIMLIVTLSFFTYSRWLTTYTISLHDALPISSPRRSWIAPVRMCMPLISDAFRGSGADIATGACTSDFYGVALVGARSEEHTSELQSHSDLVCRLLLEKKKNIDVILVAGLLIP